MAEIYGTDLSGIEGTLVRFEAVREEDRMGQSLLGLSQRVVREGLQRALKAIETLKGDWQHWANAVLSSGYTITMSPAETPKTSAGLDLPLAVMMLQAAVLMNFEKLSERIERLETKAHAEKDSAKRERLLKTVEEHIRGREIALKYRERFVKNRSKYTLIGTLSITDGSVRATESGMFGMMACVPPSHILVVPGECECHASLIAEAKRGLTVWIIDSLQEAWNVILGLEKPRVARYRREDIAPKVFTKYVPDLRNIEGLSSAKHAMMVALAGGHNILLVGPRGQGKTMLAQAATRLLPDLSRDEMFEVNKVFSAGGKLNAGELVMDRPFRQVSPNTTEAALYGGRSKPHPGEISLAHRGVLLIDEINLCDTYVIESLRLPLNDKKIEVQRVAGSVTFPCSFLLVAAMNPCLCGNYMLNRCPNCEKLFFGEEFCPKDGARLRTECTCSAAQVAGFRRKISQPVLDRIPLKVFVSVREDPSRAFRFGTEAVRKKIQEARNIQYSRFKNCEFAKCNADVPNKAEFARLCRGEEGIQEFVFKQYFEKLGLSKRGEINLLLVARTVADLADSRRVETDHVKTAAEYMGLENPYFRSLESSLA